MLFYVDGVEKNVILKAWDEDGNQWGPDCFQDMETNHHEEEELTEKEYQQIVDYWREEVDNYNDGGCSEQFGDPEESRTKEFGFWAY